MSLKVLRIPPPQAEDGVGSWTDHNPGEEDDYAAASNLVLLARGTDNAATTTRHLADERRKKFPYACGVCGRDFPSYQALGGHKTSHRSKPPPAAAFEMIDSFAASGGDRNPVLSVHKCAVCHRDFPTGQALGGHMRRHYDGVIGKSGGGAANHGAKCNSEDGSGVTSADGGGDDVMAPARWNFDLNLPPPPPPPELGVRLIKFI